MKVIIKIAESGTSLLNPEIGTQFVILHKLHHIEAWMSIGRSGRVVIEIDPALKKKLHATLMKNGLTLKEWFVLSAENYLTNTTQGSLPFDEEKHPKKEAFK